MLKLNENIVINKTAEIAIRASWNINEKLKQSFILSMKAENGLAKRSMSKIIDNIALSKKEKLPVCQDTGYPIIFLSIGRNIHIDFDIYNAIEKGIVKGYSQGGLRASIAADPIFGRDKISYSPPIIYTNITSQNTLSITLLPKGGGSENSAFIKGFRPTVDKKEIMNFIINGIIERIINSCPPVIIGIGIGGTFEHAAFLAKKALLRDIGSRNTKREYKEMERAILRELNNSDIGAFGFGGKTTAIEVFIEEHPSHIASLFVAVNPSCYALRKETWSEQFI